MDRGRGDERLVVLGPARLEIRDFGDETTAAWSETAPALHPASFPHLPFSLITGCCFSWAPSCNGPGSVSELPRSPSFPWRLSLRLAESLAPSRVMHPWRLTRPLSLAARPSPGICSHPQGPVSWDQTLLRPRPHPCTLESRWGHGRCLDPWYQSTSVYLYRLAFCFLSRQKTII